MPTFEITGPDGKKYRVTGENAEGAMSALQQHVESNDKPSMIADAAQSLASGVRSGVEGMAGMFGDTAKMQGDIASWAAEKMGASPDIQEKAATIGRHLFPIPGSPSTAEIQGVTNSIIGEAYKPETVAGEYARTIGQFAPAAVMGPGGFARKAGFALVPALASETMGQATKGTSAEPYARLAGGIGGAVATPVLGGAVNMAGGFLGFGNKGRAQKALAEALARSGKSTGEVVDDLARATQDGQGVYTVADALGDPGQRMVNGIARSPGDASRIVREAMEMRQAGQGRRIASFLDDAFMSEQGTALQKQARDTATRRSMGNANYGAASAAAGAVDTSPAIAAIDDVIQPGLTKMVGAGAVDNGVFSTLRKVRSLMSDGKAQVSDFDRAFMAKLEMDKIMEAGGVVAKMLRPARNALDDALAAASKPYANARDTYRAQSKAIEAIDIGKQAAKRGRFEDTTKTFSGLKEAERSGFRTGYVDPLIENTQGAAIGVNKARPLINDATSVEFPAFSIPGKSGQLANRIAGENTMFETRARATGGSATANNLADIGDMATFDPTIIGNMVKSPIRAAIELGTTYGGNILKGRNEQTRELLAKMLLTRDPTKANAALAEAIRSGGKLTGKQQMMIRALLGSLPARPSVSAQ